MSSAHKFGSSINLFTSSVEEGQMEEIPLLGKKKGQQAPLISSQKLLFL